MIGKRPYLLVNDVLFPGKEGTLDFSHFADDLAKMPENADVKILFLDIRVDEALLAALNERRP